MQSCEGPAGGCRFRPVPPSCLVPFHASAAAPPIPPNPCPYLPTPVHPLSNPFPRLPDPRLTDYDTLLRNLTDLRDGKEVQVGWRKRHTHACACFAVLGVGIVGRNALQPQRDRAPG